MSLSYLEGRHGLYLRPCRAWPLVLAVPAFGAMPAQGQTQPRLAVDMSVLTSPNPFLLPGSRLGAVMAQISATPGIRMIAPGGSTLDAAGTITERTYSRFYGRYVLGNAKIEGRYRSGDHLTLGVMMGYERALAIDILSSSADAASDPRGIRNDWFAGGDVVWRPDAYTLISPQLRYERMIYADSALLRNADVLTMSMAYARRTNSVTSLGMMLRDTVNTVPGVGSMNSAAVFATVKRQVGEHTRLLLELGVERAGGQIVGPDGAGISQPSSFLLAGRLDLCRERAAASRGLTGCLSGTLNSQISGFGGLRRDAAVTMTVRQPMGEHFVLRASSEYRRSAQIGASPVIGPIIGPATIAQVNATDAMRQTVMLDWGVHRNVTLTGTLQYLRRQLVTGQRIGAVFVGLQLRYQPGAHR